MFGRLRLDHSSASSAIGEEEDRVDTAQFAETVRDRGCRLIAVDRYAHQCGSGKIYMGATKASMGSGASGTISMECTGHCSKHARQPVQRS